MPEDHPLLVPIRSLLASEALDAVTKKAKSKDWSEASDLLLNSLLEVGVMSERPTWITDQGWYMFLSTDFLAHRIPKPHPAQVGDIERRMTGVFYDQVRQDSPEKMFHMANNLLIDILDLKTAFTSSKVFAAQVRDGEDIQSRAQAVSKVNAWRDQWTNIEPGSFEQKGLIKGPDEATYFTFDCSFTAYAKTGPVTEYESGGAVQFITVDKHLEVVGLMMPGFEL